jgi:ABC-type microcin C transport system duplicated ATPase subunit YejF
MTVEQIVAEGLTVHGTAAGKPSRQMVAEIMGEVGLDPALIATRTIFGWSASARSRLPCDDSAPQTGGAG